MGGRQERCSRRWIWRCGRWWLWSCGGGWKEGRLRRRCAVMREVEREKGKWMVLWWRRQERRREGRE
ncbi:unnamed protein product [Linum tenue]|uniref:Uncharacterized protein n=1 Tax=Linum tenue TaxID=586396 RepID=A0AAV0QSR5_9ROSI|nr:unnamed protein product [Linum tenue]